MPSPLLLGRRAIVSALLGCALAAPVVASGPDPSPAQIIASRHLGSERAYRVELPASYATSGEQRYPLLVVLDAQQHFAHVSATVRFLAGQGDIPEFIVVGVASGRRVHDYTQTDWPQQWVGGGGASKFRRFLADELLPTLDKSLRTSGERLLLGHSAAGQFALHLLATDSALFQGYLVISPGLDWDDRLPVRELEVVLKARERLPAFLYVAEDPSLGQALNDQLALRQVLQSHAPRALHWQVVAYPKETHGSVVLQGTIDALRARYHGYRLHPDEAPLLAELSSVRKIDALAERYALLARDGHAPQVPELAFHAVAEAHFQRQEAQAGVALLRRAAASYPGSAASREALAEGLKRMATAPQAPPSR
jgi:predicted alpha/beta superfamily hydrolase